MFERFENWLEQAPTGPTFLGWVILIPVLAVLNFVLQLAPWTWD